MNPTGFSSRYAVQCGAARHLVGWFSFWGPSRFLALLTCLRWAPRRDRAEESRSSVKTVSIDRFAFNSTPLPFRQQWQTSSSRPALGLLDTGQTSLPRFPAFRVCRRATKIPETGVDSPRTGVWAPPYDQATLFADRKRLARPRRVICRDCTGVFQADDLLTAGRSSSQIPGVASQPRALQLGTHPVEVDGGSPGIMPSVI